MMMDAKSPGQSNISQHGMSASTQKLEEILHNLSQADQHIQVSFCKMLKQVATVMAATRRIAAAAHIDVAPSYPSYSPDWRQCAPPSNTTRVCLSK